jgi:hypothetical protein
VCIALLPEIGAAAGAAFYAESGGPHTALGYAEAAVEGAIGGEVAAFCAAACVYAGSAVLGGILVNGAYGAAQGVWDYARSDEPCGSSLNGYISAGVSGALQGGIPWDQILKWANGEPLG